jgi:hypothetical protein
VQHDLQPLLPLLLLRRRRLVLLLLLLLLLLGRLLVAHRIVGAAGAVEWAGGEPEQQWQLQLPAARAPGHRCC